MPRDADVTQPIEILNNLTKPGIRVWRIIQTGDQRSDKFPRQPYDALIFSLNTRCCVQHKPCNIDGQTERENEREEQVDPGAQG
jgi:hypothetical protein